MLFTSMQSSASLQINFVPLLLFLLGTFVEYNNIEAREALEHRLLKPLGSKLRSEMTSKATGSLQGHFSYSRNHCRMLVPRVTTKMDFDYSIEYRYSWYQEYLIFYLILIVSRIVHL